MHAIKKNLPLVIAAVSFILIGIVPSESFFSTVLFVVFFVALVIHFYPIIIKKFKSKDESVQKIPVTKSINEVKPDIEVANKVIDPNSHIDKKANNKISIYVAGTSYRQNNLKKLVRKIVDLEFYDKYENMSNSEILDYGDKIYEYPEFEYLDISLVHEPTNEYDPNAIKVVVNLNETETYHIGYVPSEEIDLVNEYLEKGLMYNLVIKGGKYKDVEYDLEKDKDVVVVKNSDYFAILYFLRK